MTLFEVDEAANHIRREVDPKQQSFSVLPLMSGWKAYARLGSGNRNGSGDSRSPATHA